MPKKESAKKAKSTPQFDSTREQNVLLEHMHKDIKAIAEGHGSTKQEISSLKDVMEKRFDRVEMVLMEHSKDIKEIKQKLDTVTTDHEDRLRKLEVVR